MAISIPSSRRFSSSAPARRSERTARHVVSPKRLAWRVPRLLFAFLLGIVTLASLAARGAAEEEAAERADLVAELALPRPELSVVVGAVVSPAIETLPRETLSSYARVVGDAIAEIRRRRLAEGERLALAERQLQHARAEAARRVDQQVLTVDRDALRTNERTENTTLVAARERATRLAGITLGEIVVGPTAALIHPEAAPVFRRALPGPVALAAELEADLLVYLVVRPLDEVLLVDVHLVNTISGDDRQIVRVVAPAAQIPPLLEERARRLESALAGAVLTAVRISVIDEVGEPVPDAAIRIDGRLAGFGEVSEDRLYPGSYRLSAQADDGRTADRVVLLAPDASVEVPLRLGPAPPPTITLRSEPSGARVYRGAVFEGRTPLALPPPAAPTEFRLAAEGFRESRVTLLPGQSGTLERALIPADRDWEGDVRNARDRFYRSFGVFALSVAAPVLINGAYQNLGGLFPDGFARDDLSLDQQEDLQQRADLLFYSYYGSVGVSAGLFTWMITRLVDYIRVAQEYHTR